MMSKREKNNLHTHRLNTRLTEEENEKFLKLFENYKKENPKKTQSDFIRAQIFCDNSFVFLKKIYLDIRKTKTEILLTLSRLQRANLLQDNSYFVESLQDCNKRLEEIKKELEANFDGNDNFTKS